MVRDSQIMAGMPVDTTQERLALQEALLDSADQLNEDAQQCTHAWRRRWSDTAFERQISALSTELLGYLEGLRQEFGRAGGPVPPQVSQFLGALLGTQDQPGPLTRLQGLTGNDPETLSLEAQRLVSEVDALCIQLNGLRAQWQEYLSLLTAPEPSITRHPTQPFLSETPLQREQRPSVDFAELPPLPMKQPSRPLFHAVPAASSVESAEDWLLRSTPALVTGNLKPPPPPSAGVSVRQGMGGTLRVILTLGVALMLVVFLAYEGVSHLPPSDAQSARSTALPQVAQTATTAPEPTYTPLPQPTATTAPPPTAPPAASPTTPPAAGSTQLSVNPPVLLVPCPGSGAATLQLVDTGSQALDWRARPSGAGILLDGAASESGHLAPGGVALVSVTAQTQSAQGTITITSTGDSAPAVVSYMVSC